MSTSLTNSGIYFPDSTNQFTSSTSVGIDQTWKSVNKQANVIYTNTSGRTIFIAVTYLNEVAALQYNLIGAINVNGNTVNYVNISAYFPTITSYFPLTAVVPADAQYEIITSRSKISMWWELS